MKTVVCTVTVIIVAGLALLGACTPEEAAIPPTSAAILTEPSLPSPEPSPAPETTLPTEPEATPTAPGTTEPEPASEPETTTEPEAEAEAIPMAPAVGYRAPDFQIQRADGSFFSLSDYDRPVVMNFWNTGCPHCVTEMPLLEEAYVTMRAQGLVLFTVNIGESRETVVDFMADKKVDLPVLLDTSAQIAQAYQVRYLPTTFFIDAESVIQDVKVGAFRSQTDIENHLATIMPTGS